MKVVFENTISSYEIKTIEVDKDFILPRLHEKVIINHEAYIVMRITHFIDDKKIKVFCELL